ncbi:hypothetical protein BGM26_03005 [Bacillus sp. FJAT-29790]|uniref:hypothetical protein n=1 Tax=Bacillus sp. FJAT-29790 TaxID=1895002 RepID=UPI001C2343C0|nr:hypothetical protein [Bacillus sp. FJAT-29790]MBU8877961.1 hypothetical protein [Bacillus sp. FJAT-29790]
MGFKAEVLRVLIASPSDVQQERDEIEKAIFEWNSVYAEHLQTVLLPSRWENDVTPTYSGTYSQQVINEQLVKKCDILIGVFWAKLGTPTIEHSSGTLEEISIFIEQQKEVMVYFVDKPIPRDFDFDEVKKVNAYRTEYGKKGVYASYNVNRIVEHLFQKVIDYKSKNEVVSKSDQVNTQTKDVTEEIDKIPFEELILSGRLTQNEILLLGYILDTGNRNFGSRWMADETKKMIQNWNERCSLSNDILPNYEGVIANLVERGLLEATEYTSHGNVRLFTMPIAIFDQLRDLPVGIKYEINNVVESFYLELPF